MKFILPILFILLSVLTFVFGVNKFYKEVSALKSDIVVYNTALDNSTNLQKTEDSLIKAYNEIKQEDKDRLGNFLPSAVNNIQFVLEIERIANLHNMPIKDIRFQSIKGDNVSADSKVVVSAASNDNRPYGVFPVDFTTEGTYEAFILFLKDLEYNLRLVDVKSVSFSVSDISDKMSPGTDPNTYRYSLKIETYWLK
jgi:hypothetical protein